MSRVSVQIACFRVFYERMVIQFGAVIKVFENLEMGPEWQSGCRLKNSASGQVGARRVRRASLALVNNRLNGSLGRIDVLDDDHALVVPGAIFVAKLSVYCFGVEEVG
jgi:hypothetical protein